MARLARWGVGLVVVLATSGMASVKADTPAAAKWIAEDAIAYVEIVSPTTLLDRADDPKIKAVLAASPDYKKAIDNPKLAEFRHIAEFVAGQLDTTWEKALRDLTGGGAVLAVEGKKGVERAILVVSPTDPAFLEKAHAKLLELARKDASDKGNPDPIKEKDYRDVHAYSVSPTEAHAIIDGKLVVANGGDALKAVIDRMKDDKGSGIGGNANFAARRAAAGKDALAFAFVRLDSLREIDPAKFGGEGPVNPAFAFLFGPWFEAARKSDWASASLTWTDGKLAADVSFGEPKDGLSKAMARYVPPKGSGAARPLNPPGTIASLSLWRDLSSIWEVRSEIFPPEAQAGLAQLDTTAGTFFGGRDFGTGVLGSLASEWRLVVARQDESTLDPVPDVKLPGFALVIDIKPEDKEFATRLMSAFQSFIGLANLGAAQSKAPPLMLGSDNFEGVTISTSKYVLPKDDKPNKKEPVNQRFNFSPSAAMVDHHFILSSTLGLARDLVKAVKAPAQATDATFLVEVDGAQLAGLISQNKQRLVMDNMVKKGNDKARSEAEIGSLEALVRYLNHGRLSANDTEDGPRFHLQFDLKP